MTDICKDKHTMVLDHIQITEKTELFVTLSWPNSNVVLLKDSMFFVKLLSNNVNFTWYYFPSNVKFYEQKFLLHICLFAITSFYRFIDTSLYPFRVLDRTFLLVWQNYD